MLYVRMRIARDTSDDPVILGSFLLNEQGKVEVRASSSEGARILNELLEDKRPIWGEYGRPYKVAEDPEGWLRALPFQYGGGYFNAELVEE